MSDDETIDLYVRLDGLLFRPNADGGVSPMLTVEITGEEREFLLMALRAMHANR